jgi:hypothetical protein
MFGNRGTNCPQSEQIPTGVWLVSQGVPHRAVPETHPVGHEGARLGGWRPVPCCTVTRVPCTFTSCNCKEVDALANCTDRHWRCLRAMATKSMTGKGVTGTKAAATCLPGTATLAGSPEEASDCGPGLMSADVACWLFSALRPPAGNDGEEDARPVACDLVVWTACQPPHWLPWPHAGCHWCTQQYTPDACSGVPSMGRTHGRWHV